MRIAEGKPRPAVVIQSDGVATPTHIIVCPFTTTLIEAPFYRVSVVPDSANGLIAPSQLMLNRLGAVRRAHIDGVIGCLGELDLTLLNAALAFILDLTG